MATARCIYACRHSKDNLLKVKLSIRMIKKGDLSGSEYDVEGDSNSNNH